MIDFTIETHLDQSPATVFEYISDPERLPTWQTNTVSSVPVSDGPLGVGSRLREVHRGPGGKELVSVVEVSECDPGRVFALEVVEGTPIHLRITLDPADDGTRMRFRAFGELTGAMRLMQPLLGRVLKRQFTQQLATLQHVLASGQTHTVL
jgi:uncharacterized protein YndB with AHSA1/START domain